MWWNVITKTKTVKFVSVMSTTNSFGLAYSNKKNRQTREIIHIIIDYNKTMGGADLVSRVLIPYSSE